MRNSLPLAGFLLASVLSGSAAAQTADALAGHRAVYDLSLVRSSGKQSMDSVRGRILYDFAGSPCEGYTLNFRQVTEIDSGEGKSVVSDLRTTNFEEGDGSSFRFVTQNFLDNKPEANSEGSGQRRDSKANVKLTKPAAKTLDLGDVIFPSEHMRRIIVAAREGKKILEVAVYDGADNGEKTYNTLTVIGAEIAAGAKQPDDAAAGKLNSSKRWPVTISYFDKSKADGDMTPAYAISFELYENGVARAIKIDYGTFVLDGKLSALDMHAAKACK